MEEGRYLGSEDERDAAAACAGLPQHALRPGETFFALNRAVQVAPPCDPGLRVEDALDVDFVAD